MADKPKNDLPKVPPFVIPGASNQHAEEPTPQSAHVVQAPKSRNNNDKNLGIFSSLILLISVISLGVAMASGAWFAYSVLGPETEVEEQTPAQTEQPQDGVPADTTDSENNVAEEVPADTTDGEDKAAEETDDQMLSTLSKIIVVGLAYVVGWIFSVIGVRALGNLILPYAIRVYAWIVLAGIVALQTVIITRLYQQEYHLSNYIKYLSLFGAGLIALVGLHLILEKHSLMPFGVTILLASLVHLYSIVYHYIFVTDVVHEKLWGDIIFFFVTTLVSILMLAHLGLLKGMRRLIAHIFSPKDNQFVSQN